MATHVDRSCYVVPTQGEEVATLTSNQSSFGAVLFVDAAFLDAMLDEGLRLFDFLGRILDREALASDAVDALTYLELQEGREKLVSILHSFSNGLHAPTQLVKLVGLDWNSVYSSSWTSMFEEAHRLAGVQILKIASTSDYSQAAGLGSFQKRLLFKVAGCIERCSKSGGKEDIIATQRDTERNASYRRAVTERLCLSTLTKPLVCMVKSVRDTHVRGFLSHIRSLRSRMGATSDVHVVAIDEDRVAQRILQADGFSVRFAKPEEIIETVASLGLGIDEDKVAYEDKASQPRFARSSPEFLPVEDLLKVPPAPSRMFTGSPATLADVKEGLTFERNAVEQRLRERILRSECRFVAILGVAGIGKTTLARRLLWQLSQEGHPCWEHSSHLPVSEGNINGLDDALRMAEKCGFLLIDNCTDSQGVVNRVADGLARKGLTGIKLILTAETSAWEPRTKSRNLFSNGAIETLGKLDDRDVEALVHLLTHSDKLRPLVDRVFQNRGAEEKRRYIRRQCRSDMFVALKYLSSSEKIDDIILREYANLPDDNVRELYRTVAALEAGGTRVHRQMVLRLREDYVHGLHEMMNILAGMIEEASESEGAGIFSWQTRHEVVAKLLARYKFSDEAELTRLLRATIESLNPTISLERKTISGLCNSEFGIRRISDPKVRIDLFETLVQVAPYERVPRHRLIREYLDLDREADAELAIAEAIEYVGEDSPLHRYRVLVLIDRALKAKNLMKGDRLHILGTAWAEAVRCTSKYSGDKYAYLVLGNVAEAFLDVGNATDKAKTALEIMEDAESAILDPDYSRRVHEFRMRIRSRSMGL